MSLLLGGVTLASSSASAAALSTPHALSSASRCGYWRWPVKTGADADRAKVDRRAIDTTILYLRTRREPSVYPQDRRISFVEYHTFQVNSVWLTEVREESDSDFHLVLKDAAGRSMIAEIPAPSCVSKISPWRSAIAATRWYFTKHYRVTTSWHYIHRLVDVRGLGFFDEIHGQIGLAPNGIELHPVIWMKFLPTSTRAASCIASAAPADDGYPNDYYVYVHSNQPYAQARASDANDTWSDETNASGYARILLYHTHPGESITVRVGTARCSTAA